MDFLIEESKARNATIVYCASLASCCGAFLRGLCNFHLPGTHIFDGLDIFPTQVIHMQLGRTPIKPLQWPLPADEASRAAVGSPAGASSLLGIALGWLREDRDLRKKMEKEKGSKQRGARAEVSNTVDRVKGKAKD